MEHDAEFMHLFPRMWNYKFSDEDYKPWAAYRTRTEVLRDENGEILRDPQGRPQRGEVLDFGRKRIYTTADGESYAILEPTFAENLNYFFNYQLSYMYWRYFLWNFVGRQSDIQPSRSPITDGNWLSGIRWIDEKFVGPQENLPPEVAGNRGRNTYYFLPFLLGLVGLVYQLNRDQRNFTIVMWLFIMTGIALVVYFNTSPAEPRERDYVYAGSFYAFAIWIGFGVLAVKALLEKLFRRSTPLLSERLRSSVWAFRPFWRPRTGTTTTVRTAPSRATSVGTTSSRRCPTRSSSTTATTTLSPCGSIRRSTACAPTCG